ncbi:DnaB-like helicase C-terminal domain-containing protein [Aeribacillus sp. FSL M8-0254]|uniref:DnaB-like helicase C-terminal domain-containing protein n=1 Tax=Aeribacillus sp. FSL M8-0254 TaxID=2954577 RepID=UPI0030FC9248
MSYSHMLFSKIIDDNNVAVLKRYNITEDDFATEGEREIYRFIVNYAEQNGGRAPSHEVVAEECEDFVPMPGIEDSYEYLVREVKDLAAKVALDRFLSKFAEKFNSGERGKILLEDLQKNVELIKIRTDVRKSFGTDLNNVKSQFLAEYERRKSGESFRVWKSKFDFINRAVGGYVSSNVYTIYGKSGRGKSVIALEEAIEAALQGANVLIWAMEMGWFEVWVRIFVSLSGRQGITTANIDGVDMNAGFDSSALRNGKLPYEFETAFKFFLDGVNEQISGNIIVRAVDDEDFQFRNLRSLEADIIATNADVVVLDPFYYLDYEKNTSKTAGGDAAETSKKLRRLAGRTHSVIFAITQAEETKESKDDDGNRELKLPDREDVKKTKQLLEDAYLLIGVDTDYKQGRGLIGLNKGRDGGEGETQEILYIPQYGIVREPETGDAVVGQFEF